MKHFHRGGQATCWPWRQFAFRAFGRHVQLTVSRVKPLPEEKVPA